jgi:MoaA/NifB/PqqE/SkfB family radical SAM enzyme
MIRMAFTRGLRPSVVTNGWLLLQKLPELRAAGLKSVIISLDAPEVEAHERNRGLKGVCARIRAANATMRGWNMKSTASVTINRMIGDFGALPAFLRSLGFDSVTFSYPKRARVGTSLLAYSETSSLIDYTPEELARAFDEVRKLKRAMPVLNPSESLANMARHLRGEKESFACYGGLKHFYMDYDYNVFRCDSWSGKMCTVWEFKDAPLIRDGCTACMSDCYRDSSVYLHLAVSIGDAIAHLRKGRLGKGTGALATRQNWRSIKSLLEGKRALSRLMRAG